MEARTGRTSAEAGRARESDRDWRKSQRNRGPVNRTWSGTFTDPNTREFVTISPDLTVTRTPNDERSRIGAFIEDYLIPGPTSAGIIPMMAPVVGPMAAFGGYLARQGHNLQPGPTPQDLREARGREGDDGRGILQSLMANISGEDTGERSAIQDIIDRILNPPAPAPEPAPGQIPFNPLTYGQPGSAHAFDFFPNQDPLPAASQQPASSPQPAFLRSLFNF